MRNTLFWMSIFILLISNFMITIFLIPFLLALTGTILYLVVIALGLIIGMIFAHLIRDIEGLERKHHVLAGILIPLVGVIDLAFIISLTNDIARILQIRVQQDPLAVGLVFVSSFLFPYVSTIGGRK